MRVAIAWRIASWITIGVLSMPGALAQDPSDETTHGGADLVSELTTRAAAKEMALQKLNAQFRLVSTRQPRWRPWRQFAYSETNASCTEAGLIERMVLSYPFMKTPPTIYTLSTTTKTVNGKSKKITVVKTSQAKAARPSSRLVEEGATTQMVGQLVGAAGDLFELSSNISNSLRSEKSGLGPRGYAVKAKLLTAQVDDLLARRDQVVQTLPEDERSVARAEGAVLKDVRDLAVLQFVQYRSGARNLKTFQNAAYVLNIAKNAAGAAGNMLNLESTHASQPKLTGGASVLTTVAGAIIVATPVLGRVSGNLAGLVDRRIASRGFTRRQRHQSDEFSRDRQHLAELLASSSVQDDDALLRNKVYEQEERLFTDQKDNLARESRLARKTTIENVVFGTIVGSSRITQGALGMVGAWRYYDKSWMNSRFTAAGATAYMAGTSFNILETARVRTEAELSAQKLKKQQLLPSQVVQNRIDTLAAMQKSLETISIAAPAKQANLDVAH